MSSLAMKRLLVAAVSFIGVLDAVVLAHAASAAGDPPIVSVGTTSSVATEGRSSGSGGAGDAQAAPAAREQSSASAARARSVAAANARGIVIARIRFVRSEVRSAGRLRVIASVRDVDGRPIRDAIVFLRALPGAKPALSGSQATYSNKLGQARFAMVVPRRLLGQRLRFLVGARTPTAHTLDLASVRLVVPL